MIQSKIILISFLLVIISSCSSEHNLVVELTNTTGISQETPIRVSGYQMGEITDINMGQQHQRIFATMRFSEDVNPIPLDSKFKSVNQDLFGRKAIEIEWGESVECYEWNDTVDGIDKEVPLNGALLLQNALQELKELTGGNQRDSILFELRRLNENLENQEKQ